MNSFTVIHLNWFTTVMLRHVFLWYRKVGLVTTLLCVIIVWILIKLAGSVSVLRYGGLWVWFYLGMHSSFDKECKINSIKPNQLLINQFTFQAFWNPPWAWSAVRRTCSLCREATSAAWTGAGPGNYGSCTGRTCRDNTGLTSVFLYNFANERKQTDLTGYSSII